MIFFRILLVLFFLTTMRTNEAQSSADALTNDSSQLTASVDSDSQKGYHLVTPPSLHRKRVETLYNRIHSQFPSAELKNSTKEMIVYRMVVKYFDTIDQAKLLRAELRKNTKTPFIVKTNDLYSVIASSQMTQKSALAEQEELSEKQIKTTILKTSQLLPNWQITNGSNLALREAVTMAYAMSLKGFILTIEPLESRVPDKPREVLNRLLTQEMYRLK